MKMKHRRISFWFYSMVVICTAALVFLVKPLTLGIQQRWDIVVYQESRNTESETGMKTGALERNGPVRCTLLIRPAKLIENMAKKS